MRVSTAMFRVPNTVEGRAFIKSMHKYKTPVIQVKRFSRVSRKLYSQTDAARLRHVISSMPQMYAEYFGVYVSAKRGQE